MLESKSFVQACFYLPAIDSIVNNSSTRIFCPILQTCTTQLAYNQGSKNVYEVVQEKWGMGMHITEKTTALTMH